MYSRCLTGKLKLTTVEFREMEDDAQSRLHVTLLLSC